MASLKGEVGAAEVPNIFMAYADTAYAADQLGGIADIKKYLTSSGVFPLPPQPVITAVIASAAQNAAVLFCFIKKSFPFHFL